MDVHTLKYVSWQMSKEGRELKDILLREFPETCIQVIRRMNKRTGAATTIGGAFVDYFTIMRIARDKRELIREKKSPRLFEYYTVPLTAKTFFTKKCGDEQALHTFDAADRLVVYSSLHESFAHLDQTPYELTEEQQLSVWQSIPQRREHYRVHDLLGILLEEHPYGIVSIVREHDPSMNTVIVHDAYFSKEQAQEEMYVSESIAKGDARNRSRAEGRHSTPYTYHLLQAPVETLVAQHVYDPFVESMFTTEECVDVFISLEQKLHALSIEHELMKK
ncbi:MAG: hypothetical protein V1725_07595 [archaeon]